MVLIDYAKRKAKDASSASVGNTVEIPRRHRGVSEGQRHRSPSRDRGGLSGGSLHTTAGRLQSPKRNVRTHMDRLQNGNSHSLTTGKGSKPNRNTTPDNNPPWLGDWINASTTTPGNDQEEPQPRISGLSFASLDDLFADADADADVDAEAEGHASGGSLASRNNSGASINSFARDESTGGGSLCGGSSRANFPFAAKKRNNSSRSLNGSSAHGRPRLSRSISPADSLGSHKSLGGSCKANFPFAAKKRSKNSTGLAGGSLHSKLSPMPKRQLITSSDHRRRGNTSGSEGGISPASSVNSFGGCDHDDTKQQNQPGSKANFPFASKKGNNAKPGLKGGSLHRNISPKPNRQHISLSEHGKPGSIPQLTKSISPASSVESFGGDDHSTKLDKGPKPNFQFPSKKGKKNDNNGSTKLDMGPKPSFPFASKKGNKKGGKAGASPKGGSKGKFPTNSPRLPSNSPRRLPTNPPRGQANSPRGPVNSLKKPAKTTDDNPEQEQKEELEPKKRASAAASDLMAAVGELSNEAGAPASPIRIPKPMDISNLNSSAHSPRRISRKERMNISASDISNSGHSPRRISRKERMSMNVSDMSNTGSSHSPTPTPTARRRSGGRLSDTGSDRGGGKRDSRKDKLAAAIAEATRMADMSVSNNGIIDVGIGGSSIGGSGKRRSVFSRKERKSLASKKSDAEIAPTEWSRGDKDAKTLDDMPSLMKDDSLGQSSKSTNSKKVHDLLGGDSLGQSSESNNHDTFPQIQTSSEMNESSNSNNNEMPSLLPSKPLINVKKTPPRGNRRAPRRHGAGMDEAMPTAFNPAAMKPNVKRPNPFRRCNTSDLVKEHRNRRPTVLVEMEFGDDEDFDMSNSSEHSDTDFLEQDFDAKKGSSFQRTLTPHQEQEQQQAKSSQSQLQETHDWSKPSVQTVDWVNDSKEDLSRSKPANKRTSLVRSASARVGGSSSTKSEKASEKKSNQPKRGELRSSLSMSNVFVKKKPALDKQISFTIRRRKQQEGPANKKPEEGNSSTFDKLSESLHLNSSANLGEAPLPLSLERGKSLGAMALSRPTLSRGKSAGVEQAFALSRPTLHRGKSASVDQAFAAMMKPKLKRSVSGGGAQTAGGVGGGPSFTFISGANSQRKDGNVSGVSNASPWPTTITGANLKQTGSNVSASSLGRSASPGPTSAIRTKLKGPSSDGSGVSLGRSLSPGSRDNLLDDSSDEATPLPTPGLRAGATTSSLGSGASLGRSASPGPTSVMGTKLKRYCSTGYSSSASGASLGRSISPASRPSLMDDSSGGSLALSPPRKPARATSASFGFGVPDTKFGYEKRKQEAVRRERGRSPGPKPMTLKRATSMGNASSGSCLISSTDSDGVHSHMQLASSNTGRSRSGGHDAMYKHMQMLLSPRKGRSQSGGSNADLKRVENTSSAPSTTRLSPSRINRPSPSRRGSPTGQRSRSSSINQGSRITRYYSFDEYDNSGTLGNSLNDSDLGSSIGGGRKAIRRSTSFSQAMLAFQGVKRRISVSPHRRSSVSLERFTGVRRRPASLSPDNHKTGRRERKSKSPGRKEAAKRSKSQESLQRIIIDMKSPKTPKRENKKANNLHPSSSAAPTPVIGNLDDAGLLAKGRKPKTLCRRAVTLPNSDELADMQVHAKPRHVRDPNIKKGKGCEPSRGQNLAMERGYGKSKPTAGDLGYEDGEEEDPGGTPKEISVIPSWSDNAKDIAAKRGYGKSNPTVEDLGYGAEDDSAANDMHGKTRSAVNADRRQRRRQQGRSSSLNHLKASYGYHSQSRSDDEASCDGRPRKGSIDQLLTSTTYHGNNDDDASVSSTHSRRSKQRARHRRNASMSHNGKPTDSSSFVTGSRIRRLEKGSRLGVAR